MAAFQAQAAIAAIAVGGGCDRAKAPLQALTQHLSLRRTVRGRAEVIHGSTVGDGGTTLAPAAAGVVQVADTRLAI